MANAFDQFDTPSPPAARPAGEGYQPPGNPFDAFDTPIPNNRYALPKTSAGEEVGNFVSNLGTGIEKGLFNAARLYNTGMNAQNLPQAAIAQTTARIVSGDNAPDIYGKAEANVKNAPAAINPAQKWFFDNIASEYQPRNAAERIVQGTGQGVGAGLLFPGGTSPFGLLGNALSGMGGESAGELTKGTPYEPYARMAGSTLLPMVGMLPFTFRSNAGQMIARRTEGMTDADWQRGIAMQDRARNLGIPLMGSESLDNPALRQLTADVNASRTGNPVVGNFVNQRGWQSDTQPGQAANVYQGLAGQVAPRPASTEQTAFNVQRTAEGAIQQAERDRSAQTSPYYRAAATDQVPGADVAAIVQQIDGLIARDPANLNPTLRSLRSALVLDPGRAAVAPQRVPVTTPAGGTIYRSIPGTPAVPPTYATDIETLDRARKILRDRVELPPTAAEAVGQTAANETGGGLTQLRNDMTRASPDFAYGRALHEDISQNVVDPLARSNVGRLANRAGIPENTGIQSQINIVSNPATARPHDIQFVARTLNQQDATAFPELARTYLDNAFNAAAEKLRSGPNPTVGAKFTQEVAGSPEKLANLEQILRGVAEAHGQPPNALVPGFRTALEVMERTGVIPGLGSPTASRGVTNAEASRSLAQLPNPAAYIRDRWSDMVSRGAYGDLAAALTAPESVQALRELAMLRPNARRAQTLVATMLGFGREGVAGPGQAPPSAQGQ